MEISDESFAVSAPLPTKQAWAKYVRNRWRENAVGYVQAEWNLSDGEARGLVYAQASQRTIDKIRAHKRGGLFVLLTVEAMARGTELDAMLRRFIEHERERSAHAFREHAAREARLAQMAAHLVADRGLGAVRPDRRAGQHDRAGS